jgi:hypothetical protein
MRKAGGQRVGYGTRLHPRQRDLALQHDALNQAGCERIFRDVGSGTLRKRPQLDACLEYLRPGDTLVVWRLDRLGRSLRNLVDVIAALEQRRAAPGVASPASAPAPREAESGERNREQRGEGSASTLQTRNASATWRRST